MKKRFCEYFHSTDCLKCYHTGSNNIFSLKKIGNKKEKKSLEQRKKELSYPSLPFLFITCGTTPPPPPPCPRLGGRIPLQDINSYGRHQWPISNICDQKREHFKCSVKAYEELHVLVPITAYFSRTGFNRKTPTNSFYFLFFLISYGI